MPGRQIRHGAIHGIGPAQAAALKRHGLHTAGLLAAMDESVVCRILGGRPAAP
ncbi:hypothetical protein [Streptomyces laurentii]|uniref:hypothetical protein n=1 Tax=Streptomyces laurentii TaxID=39478 RepID=UPI003679E302